MANYSCSINLLAPAVGASPRWTGKGYSPCTRMPTRWWCNGRGQQQTAYSMSTVQCWDGLVRETGCIILEMVIVVLSEVGVASRFSIWGIDQMIGNYWPTNTLDPVFQCWSLHQVSFGKPCPEQCVWFQSNLTEIVTVPHTGCDDSGYCPSSVNFTFSPPSLYPVAHWFLLWTFLYVCVHVHVRMYTHVNVAVLPGWS